MVDYNKPYRIDEAILALRENSDLVFEIRSNREKDGWFDHMLLLCIKGITGNYALRYYLKYRDDLSEPQWVLENYIPFSEKIEWFVSRLTKKDIQNSIDTVGLK